MGPDWRAMRRGDAAGSPRRRMGSSRCPALCRSFVVPRMGQRTLVQVEPATDGDAVLVRLLDPGLAGIAATLEIVRQAHVTHSRPVHAEQVLLKTRFPLRHGEQ